MAFDRTDPADLAALKSEVTVDPNTYGYNPADTSGVLAIINLDRAEIIVSKPKVGAAAIRSATTFDAYDGLLTPEQGWLTWLTGSNGFEEEQLVANAELRLKLAGLGGAPTDSIWAAGERDEMNAAMTAIFDVPGSRAEELFGFGTTISREDWLAARES